jgi:hypothetical protein
VAPTIGALTAMNAPCIFTVFSYPTGAQIRQTNLIAR